MAKHKLTDGYVEALKADGRDQVIWDEGLARFGLRVTPRGRKLYVVQYRAKPAPGHPSTTRKVVIGEHDGKLWNVTKARSQARKVLGAVDAGGDPVAEREAAAEAARMEREAQAEAQARAASEAASRERDRFGAVAERYIATALAGKRTAREIARLLRQGPVAAWGERHVSAIRRADVADLVDAIRQRSPATARLTFAYLRGLFAWCIERELLAVSPCDHVKAPRRPAARDRVLAPAEIASVWQGAESLGHPFAAIFKLLILTGQREAEVAGMRWAELDLEAGTWTLPKERTKNAREHVVDLSPQALAVIRAVPRDGELLFSARRAPARKHIRPEGAPAERPVVGFAAAKRILDGDVTRKTKAAPPTVGLKEWRIHDLRRTAATGMAELGFAPHVVERVLNHVTSLGALTVTYQRFDYRDDRRRALAAWGRRVEEIVTGKAAASNVRRFRA